MIRDAAPLLLALVFVAAMAPPSAAAPPSFLVYSCSSPAGQDADKGELCRVAADGRKERPITQGGDVDGPDHIHPSLARDGSVLAFVFGIDELSLYAAHTDGSDRRALPTTDARHPSVSPDGTRIAYAEEVEANEGEPGPHRTPVLHTVNADGTNRVAWGRNLNYPTWWGERVVAVPGGLDGGDRVCLVREASGECERALVSLPGQVLRSPAVSPDGKLLAAVVDRGTVTSADEGIHLFSTTTGARTGTVIGNTGAERPTWSPDGRAIAFSDTGRVHVVPLGNPAAIQMLGHGDDPSWGGPAGSASAGLKLTSVTVTGRRVIARGKIAPAARERLHVSFTGNSPVGYGRTWWPKTGSGGRFTLSHTIPRGDNREVGMRDCRLVVTYPGDSTHLRSTAYRKPRQGVCKK